MSFADYFEGVEAVVRANTPIIVGAGVAVLVLIAFYVMLAFRNRPPEFAPPAAKVSGGGTKVLTKELALTWEPPEQSYADRRGSVRRDGRPVRVILSSPIFRN
jgi:hypothetical protein